jgi:hypothetical protein
MDAIYLACAKPDGKTVPKRAAQHSFFVMIKCGGHHDNVSPQRKGRCDRTTASPISYCKTPTNAAARLLTSVSQVGEGRKIWQK